METVESVVILLRKQNYLPPWQQPHMPNLHMYVSHHKRNRSEVDFTGSLRICSMKEGKPLREICSCQNNPRMFKRATAYRQLMQDACYISYASWIHLSRQANHQPICLKAQQIGFQLFRSPMYNQEPVIRPQNLCGPGNKNNPSNDATRHGKLSSDHHFFLSMSALQTDTILRLRSLGKMDLFYEATPFVLIHDLNKIIALQKKKNNNVGNCGM